MYKSLAATESLKDWKGTNKKQKVISDNIGRYALVSLTPVLINVIHLGNKELEDRNIISVGQCNWGGRESILSNKPGFILR